MVKEGNVSGINLYSEFLLLRGDNIIIIVTKRNAITDSSKCFWKKATKYRSNELVNYTHIYIYGIYIAHVYHMNFSSSLGIETHITE